MHANHRLGAGACIPHAIKDNGAKCQRDVLEQRASSARIDANNHHLGADRV